MYIYKDLVLVGPKMHMQCGSCSKIRPFTDDLLMITNKSGILRENVKVYALPSRKHEVMVPRANDFVGKLVCENSYWDLNFSYSLKLIWN
jgi:hypothetical protein